jgi:hypothetical protein
MVMRGSVYGYGRGKDHRPQQRRVEAAPDLDHRTTYDHADVGDRSYIVDYHLDEA